MISIITGTLNRLKLLPEIIKNTVDSNNLLELILVDGGSTDGTIEYIKKLNHQQIKLIEIGHRSSYAHFMNLGIKESKYEYICQWNDDVLLMNDWDEVINQIDDSDYFIFPWCRGELNNFDKDYVKSLKQILFPHCMNFGIYKKEIFRELGMYDSDFLYYCCDEDMTFRCSKFGKKLKIMTNIKVFEIETINGEKLPKNATEDSKDRQLLQENIQLYNKRILKNNLEKL